MNFIPLPDARELPLDLGWQMWDEAKLDQDTGFLGLEPIEQDKVRETLRSSFRREVMA